MDHTQLTPMTVRKALVRRRITEGTLHRQSVPIPELADAETPHMTPEITLRPVTDSEANAAECVMLRYLKLPEGTDLDALRSGGVDMADIELAGMTEGQAWADYTLVAAAIVPAEGDEAWKPEDVAALPPGVPGRLAKIVRRISGLNKEGQAEAESFRQK